MKKKAFSLIELLVTIILFSILLVTTLYSFRFISLNVRKIDNTNPQKAINYDLLRRVISSIQFYVDFNSSRGYYHYFRGSSKECFFITKSPIYSKDISLVHLIYKDNKFWYEEGKIFGENIDYLELETINFTNRLLISDNLSNVDFSYYLLGNYKKDIEYKIPSLIKIKLTYKFFIEENLYKIESDNTLHLDTIIDEAREL